MSVQANQTLARRYLEDFWNRGRRGSDRRDRGRADALSGTWPGQRIDGILEKLKQRRAALLTIYPVAALRRRGCDRVPAIGP